MPTMKYDNADKTEFRPKAASQVSGSNGKGSTKGDVGMSPPSAQGPGNHGDFVSKRSRGQGITFKGDPVQKY